MFPFPGWLFLFSLDVIPRNKNIQKFRLQIAQTVKIVYLRLNGKQTDK